LFARVFEITDFIDTNVKNSTTLSIDLYSKFLTHITPAHPFTLF
jgi:hypothetical protein